MVEVIYVAFVGYSLNSWRGCVVYRTEVPRVFARESRWSEFLRFLFFAGFIAWVIRWKDWREDALWFESSLFFIGRFRFPSLAKHREVDNGVALLVSDFHLKQLKELIVRAENIIR